MEDNAAIDEYDYELAIATEIYEQCYSNFEEYIEQRSAEDGR